MTGLTVLCVFDMPISLVGKVSGGTVYVGSGPGNATASIQDAIDNHANPGDTIFVHSGTYAEDINVDITINLTGEDRDSTIIMGDGSGTVVYIDAAWVNITGFTITNGTFGCMISGSSSSNNNTIASNNISSNNNDGIYMWSTSNNLITGNNFSSNSKCGISIEESSNNTIATNNISSNYRDGFYMWSSTNNIITGNNFSSNNWSGISLEESYNNTIASNNISLHSDCGIYFWQSSNNTITGNNITNNTQGIFLYGSSNNTIVCNNTFLSNDNGIYLITASYSTITYNNFTNNEDGIDLESFSNNNRITDNNVSSNNDCGIELESSSNNTITGNNFTNNTQGIYLIESLNNTIAGNNISLNNNHGIYLDTASYSTITSNNISSNTMNGIYLNTASNNTITDNNISNNYRGIRVTPSSNDNTITGNYVSSNIDDGISVGSFSKNNTIAGNTILNNTYGIYLDSISSNSIIMGNNVSWNNNTGIYLWSSANNIITDNNISSNDDGIRMGSSSNNNTINGNNISNNYDGILVSSSSNNTITGNNISSNNDDGIYMWSSSNNNTIVGNNVLNNTYGIYLGSALNNTITDNNVSWNNNSGIYLWSSSNNTIADNNVSSSDDGIRMSSSSNDNTITDNNVSDNNDGILVSSSSNNTITGNYVSSNNNSGIYMWSSANNNNIVGNNVLNNTYGMYLGSTPNNTIIGNNVSWNDNTGIYLWSSSNNSIYHNNIINNTNQGFDNTIYGNQWDNGYPSGGNYWSDYAGVDIFRGPLQDIPGPDWIGDTNYTIDANSIDHYPLMLPTFLIPPRISNATVDPDLQETGGWINITCDVTDNIGVYDVRVNITLPGGGYINDSMTQGPGDQWYYNNTHTLLGLYPYTIWANDINNNWNSSSGYSFIIQDTTLPVISNVLDDPDTQETGGWINITCDVTDTIGAYGVWVNITLPGGGYINISMTKGPGDQWYNETKYTALGTYNYVIWTNDTSDNWNSSSGHNFTIHDTTSPEILCVGAVPDTQEIGGYVNISCNVPDNVGVYSVWVNITLPNGSYINTSMTKGPGDQWYNNAIHTTLGTYDYFIWVNDTSGNWNSSSGYNFTVQDTTSPEIVNPIVTPGTPESGGDVNITVDITDTIGVDEVWINITYPNGSSIIVIMDPSTGDEWFFNATLIVPGTYTYVIWANDTSDNLNWTGPGIFNVEDTTAPWITTPIITPGTPESGGDVNITVNITDIAGVDEVWINITYPNGSSINVSMDTGVVNGWFLNTTLIEPGTYSYTIWVNDTSGNLNWTKPDMFTVEDTTPPTITNPTATPGIQNAGSNVNITVDVIDIVGVDEVWINITYPDGSWKNVKMNQSSGNEWYYNVSYKDSGEHTYTIWADDTSGNGINLPGPGFTILPDLPYNIIVISGNGQSGTVGTQLAAPFVVEVRDQYGNVVPNADVWFNITAGSGLLDIAGPVSTGNNGKAQTNLTLDTLVGINTVTVEISGEGTTQMIFNAIGNPDTPYNIVLISGDGQSGTVGTELAAPFIIEVQDQYGNPVPNADVWFNVTAESGSLDTMNPVLTDGNGRAQTILTLGTGVGINTINAEIGGGGNTQVILTATGNPDAAYNIMIVSGNDQSGKVGTQLAEPFVVEIYDQYGNHLSGVAVSFSIISGNGSLDITNPLTDSNGRARTNLVLGATAGINTVTAEISGGGTTQVIFTATGLSNEPVINTAVSNIELLEDDPPYTLSLSNYALDDEDLQQDLMWFVTNSDNSLYTVSGQGTDTLVITTKPNECGNDMVTLWVMDSDGLQDSQPLWINITPVNDKPFFFPEPPDLTITVDVSYTFDYEPYIHDVDNDINELTITSSDFDQTSMGDYKVTYSYPSSMIGQQVFVILTLSDGLDDASEVIQVNITDDNVPVVINELPDVTMYEGDTRLNVFDLDDFFDDPDGDAIYFSYGYTHIKIIIIENHSVDFHAESNWFGEENVTFRARDPDYAIAEDTIKVTVLPRNDPPSISDVPDLVVHYNATYCFDLTPYIFDADNTDEELSLSFMEFSVGTWVETKYIHISAINNLKMAIKYPEIHLGMTFRVKIEVSDGLDSASDIINITVSENWPPEVLKEMPDAVLYEDGYLSNYFNLTHYFRDPDNDTLFYTYGQVHVGIVIHNNNSVDFYADPNWYGTENITIRATDPSSALGEDIITVTVLPVNDFPILSQIPDQEGVSGETWILNLKSYLSDVDNDITELEIICDSPYITVAGTVLIFQYPEDIKEDTAQIIVRDPSDANVSTVFNITLSEVGMARGGGVDIVQYILTIILIIAILASILLLYAYQRGKYEVEELFLVYGKSGNLISHQGEKEYEDRDIMASMFTAVQDFISDAFDPEDHTKVPLKVMEIGDKKVMIERGEYTYLAAVFRGGTWRLASKIKKTVANIETEYGDKLKDWDGVVDDFEGIHKHFDNLMESE